MTETLVSPYSYLILALSAFLMNIPCGFIRENHPKFSFKWFFWIHASIPIIIYFRILLSIPNSFIFTSINIAVIGQIIGGYLRKKTMPLSQKEALDQIPDLDKNPASIPDSEIMVTLLNMGGPKTNEDVREFQKRLFNDSLLIRFPLSWALQRIFASLLIFFRLNAVKERYQEIGGGSPIFESTMHQMQALKKELDRRGRNLAVNFSFNYSSPLPEETIQEMKKKDKKYMLPLSLYPHYSKATTGSNIHYLKESARSLYPELKFLQAPSYFLDKQYIQAFVDRIYETIEPDENLNDFYLLFSAHSLPLYFLTEGDLYPYQVAQTASCVVGKLGRRGDWSLAYQSSVGPLQWIKPATEDMLEALALRQIKKIIVIPISFVADHIETTHEIDIEYRQVADRLGISDFRMSKALECHPGFINALADAVEFSLPPKSATLNSTINEGESIAV